MISCLDLRRRFGEGAAAVDALAGVSLEFPKGELTAIVGLLLLAAVAGVAAAIAPSRRAAKVNIIEALLYEWSALPAKGRVAIRRCGVRTGCTGQPFTTAVGRTATRSRG